MIAIEGMRENNGFLCKSKLHPENISDISDRERSGENNSFSFKSKLQGVYFFHGQVIPSFMLIVYFPVVTPVT